MLQVEEEATAGGARGGAYPCRCPPCCMHGVRQGMQERRGGQGAYAHSYWRKAVCVRDVQQGIHDVQWTCVPPTDTYRRKTLSVHVVLQRVPLSNSFGGSREDAHGRRTVCVHRVRKAVRNQNGVECAHAEARGRPAPRMCRVSSEICIHVVIGIASEEVHSRSQSSREVHALSPNLCQRGTPALSCTKAPRRTRSLRTFIWLLFVS